MILLPDNMFVRLLDEELMTTLQNHDSDETDPIFSSARDALDGLCLPPMKSVLSDWKITSGILYYKDRAYVIPSARLAVLQQCHDHLSASHPGRFKTEELVKRDYWWPAMGAYVRRYVEGCALCQQMKADTHPTTPPLVPIDSTVIAPFTHLSMDLITDLPVSGGFDSILVVVDHGLTKGVILAPCTKTVDSAGITKLFLKHVYK
jgi:hypothetical protein